MPEDIVRTTFTRYRLGGASSLAIPLAWLRLLGPLGGGPQILDPSRGSQQGVSAHIGIHRNYDVRIGDILKEGAAGASGRAFIVLQVEPRADHVDLYHSSEIPPPIPDEFNTFTKELFWTDPDAGFLATNSSSLGGILQISSLPPGTSPTAAVKYFQLVRGDFDIWTRLTTDDGTAGNVRNALIGAQLASDSTGIFVGYRHPNGGGQAELIRYDVISGPITSTIIGAAAASSANYFVRLKRQGSRLRAFYKITAGEPAVESDWIEIFQTLASAFASAAELRVGHFGFTNNSAEGNATWVFLRHWISA